MVGGLPPLGPYIFTENIGTALQISVAATGIALLCLGGDKGHVTDVKKIKSGLQTLLVGGLAAGAAHWLAHLFGWVLDLSAHSPADLSAIAKNS